jgi:hypothetical protein
VEPRPTELSIIEQVLGDTRDRLRAAPQIPATQELVARVIAFERRIARWAEESPAPGEAASTLEKVLALNIDLMRAGLDGDDLAGPV